MKTYRLVIALIATMLTACAQLDHTRVNWPVSVVPWENVMDRVGSAEVVILCFVDSYDADRQSEGSSPTKTPAQMLYSYLLSVRSLDRQDLRTPTGEADLKKMKLLVVEGRDQTRDRARALFTQLGIGNYDGSIPVVYVFHNKQLVTTYTYRRNPGRDGSELGTLVNNLLKAK